MFHIYPPLILALQKQTKYNIGILKKYNLSFETTVDLAVIVVSLILAKTSFVDNKKM